MSFLLCVYCASDEFSRFRSTSVRSRPSAMVQTASYVCAAYFECVTPILASSDVKLLLVCAKRMIVSALGSSSTVLFVECNSSYARARRNPSEICANTPSACPGA